MVLFEHPASMQDSDDSASDVSETVLAPFDEDDLPRLPDEVVEDQTNEVDDFLSDDDSPASLHLENGTPAIKPRPYQLEMVEESLSKNIIIAMDTGSGKTHWYLFILVQVQSSDIIAFTFMVQNWPSVTTF
jgi:superfamily II DNA or RNA helicase